MMDANLPRPGLNGRDTMTGEAASPTESLVRRCRAGDRAAFGHLVERFYGFAYRLASRRVRNPEDAADVTQQALLSAYHHLGRLADPTRFEAWLARIVTNQCLTWHRRRRPVLPLDDALWNHHYGESPG
jgi:RNA polymerase sigma-70 factor (ECF subfamily)